MHGAATLESRSTGNFFAIIDGALKILITVQIG
jgi:hypothetical protein